MATPIQSTVDSKNVKWYIFDGRLFRIKEKRSDQKWFFKCKSTSCNALATVFWEPNQVGECGRVVITKGHQEDRCVEENVNLTAAVENLKKKILDRCASENIPSRRIFDTECAIAPQAVRDKLNYDSMRTTMYRKRVENFPCIPATFEEFGDEVAVHNERYGSIDGVDVFLGIHGEDKSSFALYGNTCLLDEGSEDFEELHIDGTFKSRPRVPACAQIFSILGMFHGVAVILFFALMMSRTKEAYKNVFEVIKSKFPNLAPKIIISDFETSLHIAVKFVYPDVNHVGCFFHFGQAILRKGRSFGIDVTKRTPENQVLRMLMATALLPANMVLEGFRRIEYFVEDRNLNSAAMNKTLDYFNNFWLKKVTPECFSVYGQRNRTNNVQEGFHHALNQLVDDGPNVWTLIDALLATFRRSITTFHQLETGEIAGFIKRKKWRLQDREIMKKQAALMNGSCSILQFLKSMSYRVRKQVFVSETADDDFDDTLRGPLDEGESPDESSSDDETERESDEASIDSDDIPATEEPITQRLAHRYNTRRTHAETSGEEDVDDPPVPARNVRNVRRRVTAENGQSTSAQIDPVPALANRRIQNRRLVLSDSSEEDVDDPPVQARNVRNVRRRVTAENGQSTSAQIDPVPALANRRMRNRRLVLSDSSDGEITVVPSPIRTRSGRSLLRPLAREANNDEELFFHLSTSDGSDSESVAPVTQVAGTSAAIIPSENVQTSVVQNDWLVREVYKTETTMWSKDMAEEQQCLLKGSLLGVLEQEEPNPAGKEPCVLCRNNKRTRLCLPCGHLSHCITCAKAEANTLLPYSYTDPFNDGGVSFDGNWFTPIACSMCRVIIYRYQRVRDI